MADQTTRPYQGLLVGVPSRRVNPKTTRLSLSKGSKLCLNVSWGHRIDVNSSSIVLR